MWRLSLVLSIVIPLCAASADPDYPSAIRKLHLIRDGKAPRGSVLLFTEREINAWAREEVPKTVPQGIHGQRVKLASGMANGSASMDFTKMQHATGKDMNWFLSKLLAGERPVTVNVAIRSAGGRATVFLKSIEISGVAATGSVLDFLINTFFLSLYPNAKINTPFDLDYDMEQIEIRPGVVRVTMKK